MRQMFHGGRRRHSRDAQDDARPGSHPSHDNHHHHHGKHGHRRGRHGHGRMFDYGGLRLVMLAMIAEQPRHGYEFIKLIEEQSGGSYAPSPGVIYPTLAWLDDMGYAKGEESESGRKQFAITAEGEAFLAANRAQADELRARLSAVSGERGGRSDAPSPVVRAMENLKTAMRLRLRAGALSEDAAQTIATALDAAAKAVEQS